MVAEKSARAHLYTQFLTTVGSFAVPVRLERFKLPWLHFRQSTDPLRAFRTRKGDTDDGTGAK